VTAQGLPGWNGLNIALKALVWLSSSWVSTALHSCQLARLGVPLLIADHPSHTGTMSAMPSSRTREAGESPPNALCR
jgi:hypothetical protein